MVKSFGWVVAHVIIVSAPVQRIRFLGFLDLSELTLRMLGLGMSWTWDWGLELDDNFIFI